MHLLVCQQVLLAGKPTRNRIGCFRSEVPVPLLWETPRTHRLRAATHTLVQDPFKYASDVFQIQWWVWGSSASHRPTVGISTIRRIFSLWGLAGNRVKNARARPGFAHAPHVDQRLHFERVTFLNERAVGEIPMVFCE